MIEEWTAFVEGAVRTWSYFVKMKSLYFKEVILSAIGVGLSGIAASAIQPFQTILAVDILSIPITVFSFVLIISAVFSLILSVNIGYFSDIISDRRRLIASTSILGSLGYIAVYLEKGMIIFVIGSIFFTPLISVVNQQIFALVRSSVATDQRMSGLVNAICRSVFSASWVLTPAVVSFFVIRADEMFVIYLVSAIACFMIGVPLLIISIVRPNKSEKMTADLRSGHSYWEGISLILQGEVLLKILANSLLRAALKLQSLIIGPIIMYNAGGKLADVGIVAGLGALLEIPFMLAWGAASMKLKKSDIICLAALIYAAYFFLLPIAPGVWGIYAVTILNAAGASALLSITIAYLQDLISDRPGLSTSLMSITSFAGWSLAALLLSVGVAAFGFRGTAYFGSLLSVTGGLWIWWLSRKVTL